jgi:hypothetical protein
MQALSEQASLIKSNEGKVIKIQLLRVTFANIKVLD